MHLEALELELAHAVDMHQLQRDRVEIWAFAIYHYQNMGL